MSVAILKTLEDSLTKGATEWVDIGEQYFIITLDNVVVCQTVKQNKCFGKLRKLVHKLTRKNTSPQYRPYVGSFCRVQYH